MAIAIYTVWTKDPYEPDLLALFTNDEAAQDYAKKHNGKVFADEAYDSLKEQEAMELF